MEGGDVAKVGKEASDIDYQYSAMVRKGDMRVETSKIHKTRLNSSSICCKPVLKICGLAILSGIFLASLSATIVVWGTTFIEDAIIRDMVIKNNTRTFEWWSKPPIHPLFKVRIFNYTNTERFLSGEDEKLKVEEVGPYVYRESFERVNVEFYDNGTVSYQEKRIFIHVPELSVGQMSDKLTVPNMAFLGSASIMKDAYYFTKVSLSALHRSLNVKPFITMEAELLFWGYDDPLFNLGKSVMVLQGRKDDIQNKKIGLLSSRNGTSSTRMSIHTGMDDITQIGVIDRYDGKKQLKIWGSDECNRVDGTDGSMWPPHLISEHARLYMYMKDMCRKFPVVFKQYAQVHNGITAMRFHPPRDVYARGDTHPENACYCHEHSHTCPPAGVFNSSPCAFNAPIMMSFPHFYLGDPVLLEAVDGLSPDPEKHDMFIDLHPKFGFPLGGESRFQVNIMVRKSYGIANLERFKDESILPIAWFEVVVDDLPPEIADILQDLTFATHTAKLIILYFFLATLLVVCIVAGRYAYKNHYSKPPITSMSDIYKLGAVLSTRKNNEY